MKNLILALILVAGPTVFAKNKTTPSQKRSVAYVSTSKAAAETIVRSLYGTKKDPIRTEVLGENSFRVTIGAGTAESGAAIYLVQFSTLNLKGSDENEVVANMKITYEGGN